MQNMDKANQYIDFKLSNSNWLTNFQSWNYKKFTQVVKLWNKNTQFIEFNCPNEACFAIRKIRF